MIDLEDLVKEVIREQVAGILSGVTLKKGKRGPKGKMSAERKAKLSKALKASWQARKKASKKPVTV